MAGLLSAYEHRGKTTDEAAAADLNLDPNVTWRATMPFIPRVKYADGTEDWGIPQSLIDLYKAVIAPGHAARGGKVSYEDALNVVSTVGAGGLLAKRPAGSLGAFGDIGNIKGWHGTPHKFDEFDLSKIGTGEGAQAYGHGGYLAESKDLADKFYKRILSVKHNLGVPSSRMIWDAVPESEGAAVKSARAAFESAAKANGVVDMPSNWRTFADFYNFRSQIDDLDADFMAKNGTAVEARISELKNKYATDADFRKRYHEFTGIDAKPTWAHMREPHKTAYGSALNKMDDAAGGHLYEVELDAKPHEMLDWDKSIAEQPIYQVLEDAIVDPDIKEYYMSRALNGMDGAQAYNNFFGDGKGGASASKALREKGIKGIRYLDGNSRGKGEGTYNYVFFDDKDARILTRDGEPIKGLLAD